MTAVMVKATVLNSNFKALPDFGNKYPVHSLNIIFHCFILQIHHCFAMRSLQCTISTTMKIIYIRVYNYYDLVMWVGECVCYLIKLGKNPRIGNFSPRSIAS